MCLLIVFMFFSSASNHKSLLHNHENVWVYSWVQSATLNDKPNNKPLVCRKYARTFVRRVPQKCHCWHCYPIWVRQEAVIIALVATAVSWHLVLELAGCRYILIRLSLGHKHMQQVLFECTQQPKGQSCALSVSKRIRINVSAELSWGSFPWVIQMAVGEGASKLTGFCYPWPVLSCIPLVQSFHTNYQKRWEKSALGFCFPEDGISKPQQTVGRSLNKTF